MAGFLDKFRNKVAAPSRQDSEIIERKDIDDKIALGVLLWVVAEADRKFLPEEEEEIGNILRKYSSIDKDQIPLVLNSVKEAARERIDLYAFTSEVSPGLEYKARISIIEELFRVACADKDLDDNELETIRKISGLFHLSHRDFINAKIKVKKEFGMDTVGL
ncbi:MAG: hypothetical protein B1H08_05775 [Candidatus Omnitrophica bacterium 4484_171]|nr:MAG: hypothetical protein B1H08_05775 [Candidatus Omnitrophica bacterium 4484_171]